MTILFYLGITFYQWDILWILNMAEYSPSNRLGFFILSVVTIFMDIQLNELRKCI